MKFGGSSVGDASRIVAVCQIVLARAAARPVVVVSALAGVTDLLVAAVTRAREGDREGLDPILADLERRHRWAISGALQSARVRHDLSLEIGGLFEDLRQLLRSVRILREGTPRAADALLAFGEAFSTRILAAALRDRGGAARLVDARDVIVTNARHGAAEPELEPIERRCHDRLSPILEAGEIPVVGGFVGATPEGITTTLGRGGSDTTASAVGSAMGAEEIQIWTDVDGILSADPRLVAAARPLARVSFAEAAELAYFGARVLHPASIAPAVRRNIPVRVLNSLNPSAPGTLILGDVGAEAPPVASVASRAGVVAVRVTGRRMRIDPGFLPRVLSAFDRAGLVPDLVVSSEVGVTLVVPEAEGLRAAVEAAGSDASVEVAGGRAILCVVGTGLARDPKVRAQVVDCLASLEPELMAVGGSATSASALVPESRLVECVRAVHGRFFEEPT